MMIKTYRIDITSGGSANVWHISQYLLSVLYDGDTAPHIIDARLAQTLFKAGEWTYVGEASSGN